MIKAARQADPKTTPGAGYLRASSDKQDTSTKDQKAELTAYAKKIGVHIVRWYEDDGESGWRNDREDFQRAIADAEQIHDFEVLLCWGQDRFSRFDYLEYSACLLRLRQSGTRFHTMKEGELDLWSFSEVLKSGITQDGHSKFSPSLAFNVNRGHRAKLLLGLWQGRAPFGYSITSLKRGGTGKLVPNPAEVPWVRQIIEWFLYDGLPIREICRRMEATNLRGRYKLWRIKSVRAILTNEAYRGRIVWGRRAQGEFCRIIGGEIIQISAQARCGQKTVAQPRADCIVVENAHPEIIDEVLFEQVQQALLVRVKSRHRKQSFPLTGIAVCGHCGARLAGQTGRRPGKKDMTRYICQSVRCTSSHSDALMDCRFSLNAEALHDLVFTELLDRALRDDKIEKKRQDIVQYLCQQRGSQQGKADSIEATIDRLGTEIRQAEARLVAVPDDMIGVVSARIRALRSEREAAQTELGLECRISEMTQEAMGKEASAVVCQLKRIRADIETGDWSKINAALQRLLERVTVYTCEPANPRANHKRTLDYLELEFRKNLAHTLNPSSTPSRC